MKYKGYIGEIEFDEEAEIFYGEVINTRDVITFQAETAAELKKAFHESVDDYLHFCESRGEEPEKPFSGQFVTRISPEMHREVSNRARLEGVALNAWINSLLEGAVSSRPAAKTSPIKEAARRASEAATKSKGRPAKVAKKQDEPKRVKKVAN